MKVSNVNLECGKNLVKYTNTDICMDSIITVISSNNWGRAVFTMIYNRLDQGKKEIVLFKRRFYTLDLGLCAVGIHVLVGVPRLVK